MTTPEKDHYQLWEDCGHENVIEDPSSGERVCSRCGLTVLTEPIARTDARRDGASEMKRHKESIIDVRLHVAVSRRALEKWFAYAGRYLKDFAILGYGEKTVEC